VNTCLGPNSVTIDAYSKAWVSCRDSDKIAIIDIATAEIIAQLDLPYGAQPAAILARPDGETVYVSLTGKGELSAYDASTRLLEGTLALGLHARAMAIDGNSERLLVTQFISGESATVWDIDLLNFTLSATYPLLNDTSTPDAGNSAGGLPNYLAGVAIHPLGRHALIASKKDNIDRGVF